MGAVRLPLQGVESFDAFADLEVTFSGISPNGSVKWDYNGSQFNNNYFGCDKTKGLRNGDTVTIYISYYNMEDLADTFGMIPESREKEYEVSGLDEYVEAYGQLSDAFVEGLKNEAEDTIYSYAEEYSYYHETTSLTDLVYAGYIFNSVKDGSMSHPANELYIIYSGTVSSSNGSFSDSTVYFPVRFTEIISSEGRLSYNNPNDVLMIVGLSYLVDGTYNGIRGYINPVTCYDDLVEAKRNTYNSECGDGFEVNAE